MLTSSGLCQQRFEHAVPLAFMHYERNELDFALSCLERYRPANWQVALPASVVLWHQLRARVWLAQGMAERHESVLEELSLYAIQHGIHWMQRWIEWERVVRWLQAGELERSGMVVRRLCSDPEEFGQTSGLPSFGDAVFDPVVGAIRYCIHSGRVEGALGILAPHLAQAAGQGYVVRHAKLQVLKALAWEGKGLHEEAAAAMSVALLCAHEHGLVRTFLDEGPLCAALIRNLRRGGACAMPPTVQAYRRQLLTAFEEPPGEVCDRRESCCLQSR